MGQSFGWRLTGCFACVALGAGLLLGSLGSCTGAPSAFPVVGPSQQGNEPPTLNIEEPNSNITVAQGARFLIEWTDTDRDNAATIQFWLVNSVTNTPILVSEGIPENDTIGPDSISIETALVAQGSYNLLGIIDDGVNPAVNVYAEVDGASSEQRVLVTIVGSQEAPPTQPPVVAVVQPQFNLSVSQDDRLVIRVQPSRNAPVNTIPFDGDSDITLYLVLDLDSNPNNDDAANPDPTKIIELQQPQTIPEDDFGFRDFPIDVDLNAIPPRADGSPYFIRATVTDGTNPPVHSYAVGAISVVRLVSGLVDLFDLGRTSAGATFYGFNPGALTGSTIASVGDFDADGTGDFMVVAQFGNPRNFGPIGEAYLIYGQQAARFGGSIPVNSVAETVSGAIIEAPPVRRTQIRSPDPHTDGITSVGFIRDLTGDQRPEILIGLSHVHGAFESQDFDPEDQPIAGDQGVMVEVVLRQGQVTVAEGSADPEITSSSYAGVDDVFISTAAPTTNTGSSSELGWIDAGATQREWSLIKFRNVLNQLPDPLDAIDVTTLTAQLQVRVVDTGASGTVRELIRDFTELTTFSTFAGGAEPQPNVDFVPTPDLGTISGTQAANVNVTVSDLVRRLIDGQLSSTNNELRFIVFPGTDAPTNRATIRSSEFATTADRPRLSISYTRLNLSGSDGCYPDDLPNNRDDTEDDDLNFYGGGMAVVLNSENRDNSASVAPTRDRLENTVVTIELVGQEGQWPLDGDELNQTGSIVVRAATTDEARTAGARFIAGPFDFIDARRLFQVPRDDKFGQKVSSIGDLNNDGVDEYLISAPLNERHYEDLFNAFGFESTHWFSTLLNGSIVVLPGANYNDTLWRDEADGASTIPSQDQSFPEHGPYGKCTPPAEPRHMDTPVDTFQIYAENIDDYLGGATSAGDFNQDGVDDILCGAPKNDRLPISRDGGAVYIIYGRNIIGDVRLENARDPILRTPMLRLRGERTGDQLGWKQDRGLDVNGDRIDDIFIGAPKTDFGSVTRGSCGVDFDRDGVVDSADFSKSAFDTCVSRQATEVFSNDSCAAFDYDKDGDLDFDDECVLDCLSGAGADASCNFGRLPGDCCGNLVDNGFAGIIFGGVFTDGDRDLSQLATTDLQGTAFFGAAATHQAGHDVSSAGDFNQDGFGDILIAVPGESRVDSAGRERLGVVYLVFGGTHLENTVWSLASVGSPELPGIVFLSPFVKGRPNEAPLTTVAFIGDINRDGFGDIAIGAPKADFIDLSFPQGPNASSGDADVGRRRNAGNAYIIYGNNFGTNRGIPIGGP